MVEAWVCSLNSDVLEWLQLTNGNKNQTEKLWATKSFCFVFTLFWFIQIITLNFHFIPSFSFVLIRADVGRVFMDRQMWNALRRSLWINEGNKRLSFIDTFKSSESCCAMTPKYKENERKKENGSEFFRSSFTYIVSSLVWKEFGKSSSFAFHMQRKILQKRMFDVQRWNLTVGKFS